MPKQVDCSDDCGQCGHPFSPHTLVATEGDPMKGGVILCPVMDCECYSTWGVSTGTGKSDPPTRIPDRHEVAMIREQLQHRNG